MIQNKKNIFLDVVVMSLAIFIVLLVLNSIVREIYIPLLNEDISLKIVATSEAEEISLSNNVRVRNITVNGERINLGKIELDSQEEWKYDSQSDLLFAYNITNREELCIELKNVHSLGITFIEEVGSGYVETYIDDELWFKDSLYENSDWLEKKVEYNTSIWVFPESNLLMMLSFFIFSIVVTSFIFRMKCNRKRIVHYATDIVCLWILANLIVIITSFIQYHHVTIVANYIENQLKAYLQAVVLIFLLMELLHFISGRLWVSFISMALVCSITCFVSQIKETNRGIPLLPWDFNMFFEALSVVDNYEIKFSLVETGSILLILVITYFLINIGVLNQRHGRMKERLICSVGLSVIISGYLYSGFIAVDVEDSSAVYRVYQVNNYYNDRGFITGFLECMRYMSATEKPVNYSKEMMEHIYDEVISDNKKAISYNTPNIIAIMSESFWDISQVDSITIEEKPLPVFEELKRESMYGNLFTHVLGGGTVVSEFEFLTGFSGEFFPTDYMVYGNHITTDFFSVVNLLKQQGYKTAAFHPYISSNYNRESAYDKLGFDRTYFDKDFDNPHIVRNYISDQALYDKIISEFEKEQSVSEQPLFMFAVTMQNHGGYWQNTIYEEEQINFSTNSYNEVAKGCITDYLAGLHESDRALGELVNYFRNVNEDTIIIYFGDHVSDAGPNDNRMLEETSWNENELEYSYKTHVVPYLVWCNFDQASKETDIMEIGRLLPTVFSDYNIKSTDFWDFIVELGQYYAASSSELIVESDSQYKPVSDMTTEQLKYHDYYRLIQYDYIWGDNYLEKLWHLDN